MSEIAINSILCACLSFDHNFIDNFELGEWWNKKRRRKMLIIELFVEAPLMTEWREDDKILCPLRAPAHPLWPIWHHFLNDTFHECSSHSRFQCNKCAFCGDHDIAFNLICLFFDLPFLFSWLFETMLCLRCIRWGGNSLSTMIKYRV